MAGLSRKKKKYEVYDFSEEDKRVEKASKKLLGKYAGSGKNQASPVDKYKFLQCFAQGTNPQQKDISCEPIDVDTGVSRGAKPEYMEISNKPIVVDDRVLQGETIHQKENREKLSDVDIHGLRKDCTYSVSYLEDSSRKDCTLREAVGLDISLLSCPLNDKNEQISVISDDDDCIGMSSISSSPLSDNEEERVAEQGSIGHEIDLVKKEVVVFPDFILYREMYCTESRITFSCSSIKIEGSTINGTKGTLHYEWPVGDIFKIQLEWHGRVETAIINLTLKSNNSNGAGKADEISGIQWLKFAIYDPHWFERQEAIKLLNIRYKDLWDASFDCGRDNEVNAFLGQKTKLSDRYLFEFDEPFEDVIYPKGDPDAVLISKRDVELLQPETFINDTIIDFYIQYLKNKIQPEEQHRFHFFNSFFFRKLADLDKDPSSACEGKAAFQRVRKWTKNVNLFEKDYIFIPVNYSLHWSLLVICHPGEVAYFKDDIENSLKVPCILHMDSIKGSHRGLKDLVQSYLCEEWKERHKSENEDVASKFLCLRFIPLELPQQENSFDCGLFLLHYVELFLEEAPSNFNPFKITGISNFLNSNWFLPAEASLKRARIKKLIYKICHHSNKDLPANCIDNVYPSSQLSPDKEWRETGTAILGQIFTPTKIHQQGYFSISDVEKGIEVSIFRAFPQRITRGHGDEGFILREHSQQRTACDPSCIMSPIEEGEETGEQMAKSSSDVDCCRQVAGLASESSPSNVSNDFRVSQKPSSDWRFALHFEEQDEYIREYQNSSKEEMDEDQLVADLEGSNHLENDRPNNSSTCSAKFATFLVEDSEEEISGLLGQVIEDSQEGEGLDALVVGDSQEKNELDVLVVEDSQEANELDALVVEDSQEINHTQDHCKNEDN